MVKFVDFYNNIRPHQGIGYVTPQQKHTGEDVKILEERQRRKESARKRRLEVNRLRMKKKEEEVREIGLRLTCSVKEFQFVR